MISSTTRSDLQFGTKLALMQREASQKHLRTGSMCHESLRFQDLLVSSVACLWPGTRISRPWLPFPGTCRLLRLLFIPFPGTDLSLGAWISAPGCCSRVPVACFHIKKQGKNGTENRPLSHFCYSVRIAASNATSDGEKLISFVNAQASVPPNTRSIPLSSHSMESGPSYPIWLRARMMLSKSTSP